MSGRSRCAAAVLGTCLASLLGAATASAGVSAEVSAGGLGVAAVTADDPVTDRTPTDPALTENSGLAFSLRRPGVLWTVNDSGNPPVVLALGPDGGTVARVRVPGVPNVDWEAVAAFRGPRGESLLAVADIGDNAARRTTVEIDVLPEPARTGASTQAPTARLRLTYPDGAHDAETLLVDAKRQRMFIVTKGLSATVYAVPPSVWPGTARAGATRSGTLSAVGELPLFFATDGAVLPDGHAVVRTYTALALLSPPADGDVRVLATTSLPAQRQGEGLAVDAAGTAVWLSSEGRDQPVLRLPLPAEFAQALGRNASGGASSPKASSPITSSPNATPSGGAPSPSATGSTVLPVPAPEPLQRSSSGRSTAVWNLLAGVALVVGFTVALRAWVRRR